MPGSLFCEAFADHTAKAKLCGDSGVNGVISPSINALAKMSAVAEEDPAAVDVKNIKAPIVPATVDVPFVAASIKATDTDVTVPVTVDVPLVDADRAVVADQSAVAVDVPFTVELPNASRVNVPLAVLNPAMFPDAARPNAKTAEAVAVPNALVNDEIEPDFCGHSHAEGYK